MLEESGFRGLWVCPDYLIRLNDEPPFKFKCTGLELTEEGASALHADIERIIVERN